MAKKGGHKRSTPGTRKAAHAGTTAMHAKYPKGHQTPKQLAAERTNLVAARAALAIKHPYLMPHDNAALIGRQAAAGAAQALQSMLGAAQVASSKTHGERIGLAAGLAGQKLTHLRGTKHALGVREPAFSQNPKLTIRKPTGIFKKAPKRIAPTAYDQRTGWRRSQTHNMRKRLHIRKARLVHLKSWRHRKKSWRPR